MKGFARVLGLVTQLDQSGPAALSRCPHAVVVEGHFHRYLDFSREVMDICHDATPLVEQISVDEAFLDVRGTVHLLGSPATIAAM